MNRTETVELVSVLERDEVEKLMKKEKDKADVEEQFTLKKNLLRELSGKIGVGIRLKRNRKLTPSFRMKTEKFQKTLDRKMKMKLNRYIRKNFTMNT